MNFASAYSQLGNVSSSQVAEAQTLLNAMGYGDASGRPLKVDGIWGPNTKAALERALKQSYGGVDANALEALRRLAGTGHRAPGAGVNPPGPVTVAPGANDTGLAAEPIWKKPLFIGLGAAAVAAVLFFVVKNETKVFSGSPEGAAGRRGGRGRRLANGDASVMGDEVYGLDTEALGSFVKPVQGEVVKRKTRRRCSRTPEWGEES